MNLEIKANDSAQLVTFVVNKMYLGLEVSKVQEVIRCQDMTNVPLSSQYVTGLINLRGQIMPAINLRKILGMPDHDKPPMNVVAGSESGPLCILVDEVGDVIHVHSNNYERTPETLSSSVKGISNGVIKLSKQLVLMIDPEKITSVLLN